MPEPFDLYDQTAEPVQVPPGFGSPRYKIGERVRVSFTTMAPAWQRGQEGAVGTVSCVVFCRSNGKTILYGVRYDTPVAGAIGGRWESFELDRI